MMEQTMTSIKQAEEALKIHRAGLRALVSNYVEGLGPSEDCVMSLVEIIEELEEEFCRCYMSNAILNEMLNKEDLDIRNQNLKSNWHV